jgi:general stress protein 26
VVADRDGAPPLLQSMHVIQCIEGSTMSHELTDSRTKLWDLIKDIRFAMFTTRHSNGHMHSRPMTTQNSSLDEDASLWFFMSRKGEPAADVMLDPTVNVVYADPGDDSYVSVSGTARVVEDLGKKQQLWSKMAEAWFPGGPTDPDLALVEVRITHANYWDVEESKVVQLYKMAKAVVTGKPPTNLGEHAEIRMN